MTSQREVRGRGLLRDDSDSAVSFYSPLSTEVTVVSSLSILLHTPTYPHSHLKIDLILITFCALSVLGFVTFRCDQESENFDQRDSM